MLDEDEEGVFCECKCKLNRLRAGELSVSLLPHWPVAALPARHTLYAVVLCVPNARVSCDHFNLILHAMALLPMGAPV